MCSIYQRHVRMKMKLFCDQCAKLCLRQAVGRESRRWVRRSSNDVMGTEKMHIKSSAHILWDYLRIDDLLKKSDLILLLGNSDLRTADHAAKLYHEGLAPLLVVSGREGHGTKGRWNRPEAVVFREKLLKNHVPSQSILLELKATNTGENIRFTQRLLRDHPDVLQPRSVILVQTPFMGRRCLATFLKQWEDAEQVEVAVSSPPIPLENYPSTEAGYGSFGEVVMEMVRSMDRIQQYPDEGFQVPQPVPPPVVEAAQHLKAVLGLQKL
ncbi:uncharacterized protein SCO4629-like [Babylonia areolata]|uniref:uncharacterized protein SCO4629-like n=1 Tax=Babylonia areolata TaxID=304850 RepID=UPI003FD4A0C4